MTNEQALTAYDAAKLAVSELTLDEVEGIPDELERMRAYAAIAQDRTIECGALAIRIRAKRMMRELRKSSND